MANPQKNNPVAEQVKDLMSSDTTPVALKCAKVALATGTAVGGVFAWQNPESAAVVVTRVIIDLTTKSTGAGTVNIGSAANATTSADNLLDGLDVNAATGVFDNIADKGTNGKEKQRVDAQGGTTDYVTASQTTGAVAGLVGNAYIFYHEV